MSNTYAHSAQIAELHLRAAHAHEAAAASHNQNNHLSAHEQSRLAHEHSLEALRLSEELLHKKQEQS